eukprot:CAMPEP_0196594628 /NCGR_PEP_ID=MMETSP1081-20130531/78851_1 /TAXON_ID=36882 /ORGANISM="Pyramimonas amylifera, Strain CCMP720" /LENGTH=588 /DNA_ID=CAMNT_0041918941 /DNA_START=321 /DNA_END=2087 /DNA_ORIENTATION=-
MVEAMSTKVGHSSSGRDMNAGRRVKGSGSVGNTYSCGQSLMVQTPLPPLVPAPLKHDWRDVLIAQGNLPFDYKTQWCEHFMWAGWCPAHARCHCAHSAEERRVEAAVKCGIVSPHFKTRMCRKMFWSGWCPHGPFACTFAHGADELRVEAAVSSGHLPLDFCNQKCPLSFCAVAACPQMGCTHAHFQEELREYRRYAIPGVTYSTAPPPAPPALATSIPNARATTQRCVHNKLEKVSSPFDEFRSGSIINSSLYPMKPDNCVTTSPIFKSEPLQTIASAQDYGVSFLPDDLYDDVISHDKSENFAAVYIAQTTESKKTSPSIAQSVTESSLCEPKNCAAPGMSDMFLDGSKQVLSMPVLNKVTSVKPPHISWQSGVSVDVGVNLSHLWKNSEAQSFPVPAFQNHSSILNNNVSMRANSLAPDKTYVSQEIEDDCELNIDRTVAALLANDRPSKSMGLDSNRVSKSAHSADASSYFGISNANHQLFESQKVDSEMNQSVISAIPSPTGASWTFKGIGSPSSSVFSASQRTGIRTNAFCDQSVCFSSKVTSAHKWDEVKEANQHFEPKVFSLKEGFNADEIDAMLSQLMV